MAGCAHTSVCATKLKLSAVQRTNTAQTAAGLKAQKQTHSESDCAFFSFANTIEQDIQVAESSVFATQR